MIPTPTLQTDRLTLRPVRIGDAPAVQKHFGRWEIIRNMSVVVPWPYPDDGAESWLTQMVLPSVSAGKALFWAIALKDGEGEAIGILEWRINDSEDADNRGFWIAVEHQGQGLMTEAVTAFQDWVFFDQGLKRLFVLNAADNEGSRRIKEKTGAELLGTVEVQHHSGTRETQRWIVTREAWAKLRESH